MFKKSLTHKKTIKKAEKLFDYFKLLKSVTNEKYPLIEDIDINNKNILLSDINYLIEGLKIVTKKYLDHDISLIEFNESLNSISDSYNKLRIDKPMLNTIIFAYLTPTFGGAMGTPIAGGNGTWEYLFDRIKNPPD